MLGNLVSNYKNLTPPLVTARWGPWVPLTWEPTLVQFRDKWPEVARTREGSAALNGTGWVLVGMVRIVSFMLNVFDMMKTGENACFNHFHLQISSFLWLNVKYETVTLPHNPHSIIPKSGFHPICDSLLVVPVTEWQKSVVWCKSIHLGGLSLGPGVLELPMLQSPAALKFKMPPWFNLIIFL